MLPSWGLDGYTYEYCSKANLVKIGFRVQGKLELHLATVLAFPDPIIYGFVLGLPMFYSVASECCYSIAHICVKLQNLSFL